MKRSLFQLIPLVDMQSEKAESTHDEPSVNSTVHPYASSIPSALDDFDLNAYLDDILGASNFPSNATAFCGDLFDQDFLETMHTQNESYHQENPIPPTEINNTAPDFNNETMVQYMQL